MPMGSGQGMQPGQGMGSGMNMPMTQAAPKGNAAEIKGFAFQPRSLEVSVGTTVTWTNDDAIQHSVTAADNSFDSGLFTQGGTFSHTFDKPGTYAYYCARHGSMMGEVKVV
jgi:plastocyanin